MLTVLESQKDAIQGSREKIASLLPDLWNSLHPIFNLSESSESNVWCSYVNGRLSLSTTIDLKIGNTDKVRTSRSIKEAFTPLDWIVVYSLNSYSIVINDNIDLFIHVGIPFIFVNIRLSVEVMINSFDEQAMSNNYFSFILKHGLISMSEGIITIAKEETTKKGTPKTPDLYSGLYEDK